ncbi:hypothetical protein KZI27_10560 [Curtobacterium sp. TC1]|uniref:hypothetical protein n=1 Tax=Curtobacterium sp. TC1 TaxID=2862880 RepID=UPI001C9AB369|nr:hypothetical protein [Curtobacterium sp. TC1]QZQ53809.1 hypothetical protein KZI27_10560 [Curtobacterium sp. TC1]
MFRDVQTEEAARRRTGLKEACRAVERVALSLSENGPHEELAFEGIRRARRVERIAVEADTRSAMAAAQLTLERALALLQVGAQRGIATIEFFIAVVVSLGPETTAQSPSPFLQMHEEGRRLTAELAPLLRNADKADPVVRALNAVQQELWATAATETAAIAMTRSRLRTRRAALRRMPG